jgi:predicted Zn-dependent protease
MKPIVRPGRLTVFVLLTACCLQAPLAQEQDGIKLGNRSIFSKLASQQLEAQAALQYRQTLQQAEQVHALAPADNAQLQRLRAIADRLKPYTRRWNDKASQWQWEVNLLGSREVNAYCMPGGKIAFYTGILNTLKLTDDEIAIVMGHEIGHALREHGAKRQGEATVANIFLKGAQLYAGAKGYDPNLVGAAGGQIANLTMLKFSRDDESEADLVGLDLAARAGYDPRAGIALWQKMAIVNKTAPPQWLSTHPSGEHRIQDIRQHLPAVLPLYARAKGLNPNQLPPYQSNVKALAAIN